MSSIAEGSVAEEPENVQGKPLIGSGMLVLFIALIACFTAWGIAQDLTTPMVAGFKRIFDMSTFQASLVQLAYFGAYFLLALPAAFINQRFGYKTGILTGLALAALGAFLFFPASKIMTYEAFLVALFAMAAGLLDPRDVRESLRDLAGAGGDRDAATQPGAGLQPGRDEPRRPARVDADPAEARRPRRHLDAVAGRVAHDPRR